MNTIHTTNATVRPSVARRVSALLAFGGLLAFAHPSAVKADVVILSYVGSSETVAPTPGTTAMRFYVYNTDGYTISGVKLQASLNSLNDHTMPVSSAFTMSGYQTKWVTVTIPSTGTFSRPLLNQPLTGVGYVVGGGNSPVHNVSFINVAPKSDVQSGDPLVTGTNNGVKTFRIPFKNNGYAASQAQTVTVTTYLYADGPFGPAKTQTVTIPALQIGQSVWLTFTTQPTQGYQIWGTVQVGTGNAVSFTF